MTTVGWLGPSLDIHIYANKDRTLDAHFLRGGTPRALLMPVS